MIEPLVEINYAKQRLLRRARRVVEIPGQHLGVSPQERNSFSRRLAVYRSRRGPFGQSHPQRQAQPAEIELRRPDGNTSARRLYRRLYYRGAERGSFGPVTKPLHCQQERGGEIRRRRRSTRHRHRPLQICQLAARRQSRHDAQRRLLGNEGRDQGNRPEKSRRGRGEDGRPACRTRRRGQQRPGGGDRALGQTSAGARGKGRRAQHVFFGDERHAQAVRQQAGAPGVQLRGRSDRGHQAYLRGQRLRDERAAGRQRDWLRSQDQALSLRSEKSQRAVDQSRLSQRARSQAAIFRRTVIRKRKKSAR